MKWYLITLGCILSGCLIHRNPRQNEKSNTIRLRTNEFKLNTHFKSGNYIISVNDSIGNALRKRFIELQDSLAFKEDTINLQLTNPYWTRSPVDRVLRKCIEMNAVSIYSLPTSKYLDKIKRTVSNSKFNGTYTYYLYTTKGDTILYSFSFDIGCPPF